MSGKERSEEKPKRGRPPLKMPDPIPDTLDNVLRSLVNAPPKKKGDWAYLKESEKTKP